MNKAIFLDRDGTINTGTDYYVYKIEHFKFIDGAIEAMKLFQKNGFLIFIVTNQGGIAKGLYDKTLLNETHNYMLAELHKNGIKITEVYYCPHHSDYEACLCRKPDSLLIEKALAKYDIDPEKSWIIGDNITDIQAGEKAGLNFIKIEKNDSLMKYSSKIIDDGI